MSGDTIRHRLLALQQLDAETRRRLAADGALFEGYHPEMERVHRANADALAAILDEVGWPGETRAGTDGAAAAWLVAQHAISLPDFQLRCRRLLADAVERGEVPARQLAFLTDRIRFNQRRPQVYGTIFDWDSQGRMSPWKIEEPERVEQLREQIGLPPLGQEIARIRQEAASTGEQPPGDYHSRQQQIRDWALECGWLVE